MRWPAKMRVAGDSTNTLNLNWSTKEQINLKITLLFNVSVIELETSSVGTMSIIIFTTHSIMNKKPIHFEVCKYIMSQSPLSIFIIVGEIQAHCQVLGERS